MPRSKNHNRRSSAGGDVQTPKERILDIAEDLIAEHGPYGFRLRDVADRLNVKAPALYNHFQSRDELIARVGVKLSRLSAAREFREPGEDAMTAARRRARHLVKYMYEHPAGARLILWELAQSDSMSWPESTAIDDEQRMLSRKAFQQAVADGEFRDFRWELYISMLLGGLASLVLYPSFDKSSAPVSVETLQREADELVVRILTPDEPLNRLVQRLWEKESKNSD